MNFSSYQYYYYYFIRRFSLQKSFLFTTIKLKDIYFQISYNALPNLDDTSLPLSLHSLESLAGQKAALKKSGSRYVGTTKKSFFSALLHLKSCNLYYFLELISSIYFPAAQKRTGLIRDKFLVSNRVLTLCLKDLQSFYSFFPPAIPYNVLVNIISTLDGNAFFDLLQLYKFNFVR